MAVLISLPVAHAQDTCHNYILERLYLDTSGSDSVFTVRYFDDLGRQNQMLVSGRNSDGRNLRSMVSYNFQGQVSQSWCPIPDDETQHYLAPDNFHSMSASTFSDSRPYRGFEYDALGRQVAVSMPGSAWTGRSRIVTYGSNAAGEVKHYVMWTDGEGVNEDGCYEAGSLSCITFVDEDGITVRQFSDLQGNTILERRGATACLDTYFVYDKLGLLRYVLSPMYQENADLSLYAYGYKYDERGRVIEKCIPGSDAVKFWYDKADRLVCIQDGELRAKGLFRKVFYDKLGRPVVQCLANSSPSCTDSFCLTYSIYGSGSSAYGSLVKPYGYGFVPQMGLNNSSICADMESSLTAVEVVNYYNSHAFLDLYDIPAAVRDSLDSAMDADVGANGELPVICGKPSTLLAGTVQPGINGGNLIQCHQYDAKGRIACIASVGLDGMLCTHRMRYNFVGDVLKEEKSYNRLSGSGRLETLVSSEQHNHYYPHSRLLRYRTIAVTDAAGRTQTDTLSCEYDDWGNLVRTTNQDGSSADMEYDYDPMHGWLTSIRSAGGFEQMLFRQDNSSNPLYNGSISAMSWYVPSQGGFSRRYDYIYDEAGRLEEATYSETARLNPFGPNPGIVPPVPLSNVSDPSLFNPLSLIPSTDLDFTLADAVSAQSPTVGTTASDLSVQPIFLGDKYGEKITYDKNSNITVLRRRGLLDTNSYGLIDNLTLSYHGNQRTSVSDASGSLSYDGSSDFVDGHSSSQEYSYNRNGALTRDLNRDIHNISYSNLGHPTSIAFYNGGAGNYIRYTYSADGRKLRAVHERRLSNFGYTILRDTTDYLGSLILRNGHPESYHFDGGYFSFSNDTIDGIHYFVKDYLGSNRMVIDGRADTIEQVTHYYPYGGVIGEISTRQLLQPYKFEGKELDRSFGLDNYDIHARQYYAMAPMWDRIDPLCERSTGVSPYNYCIGDPVNFGDYNGCDYWSTSDPALICQFYDAVTSYTRLEDIDMSNWYHASDTEFLSNLTYNDETKRAYYTHGDVIGDEVYLTCKVFKNDFINSLDFVAIELGVAGKFLSDLDESSEKWLKKKTGEKSKFVWDLKKSLAFEVKTPNAKIYNSITNVVKKVRPVIKGTGYGLILMDAASTGYNIYEKRAVGLGDATNIVMLAAGMYCPAVGLMYLGADLIWHIYTGGNGIDTSLNYFYEYKLP